MYERTYGSKYEETKGLRRAEIAKLIRADIKAATGTLIPDWVRTSVRTEEYSMGGSINVTVQYDPRLWQPCDGYLEDRVCPRSAQYGGHQPHDRLTLLGRGVEAIITEIQRAYNYDGSDTMSDYFDVRYYGWVTMQDESSAMWQASDKQRKAARAAARKAAA